MITEAKWKSRMSDAEREELEAARCEKEAAGQKYRSVYTKLKSRCEARMRREKE